MRRMITVGLFVTARQCLRQADNVGPIFPCPVSHFPSEEDHPSSNVDNSFCKDETTPFLSSTTKMVQFGRFLSPFPMSVLHGIYFILESVSSWGHNGERDDDPDPRGGLRKRKSKYADLGERKTALLVWSKLRENRVALKN